MDHSLHSDEALPYALPEPPEEETPQEALPEPPEEPLPSDCCGTGCQPCVFDIYHKALDEWRQLKTMSPKRRVERAKKELGKHKMRGQGAPSLSPVSYTAYRLERIKQITVDTFVYTFALNDSNQFLGLDVGQHAVLRVRDDRAGWYISRPYTPISPLDQQGSFDVAIKIYPSGRITSIIGNWEVGVMTEWRGPFGNFSYSPNKYKKVVMLACGTGVAPMVQVIRAVLENEDDYTFVRLLFGCRTQHDILMKEMLETFSSYWNFTVLHAISQCQSKQSLAADPGKIKYGDKVHFGRIDEELVRSEIPVEFTAASSLGAKEEHTHAPTADFIFLICGTKSFDKDMIKYLLRAGVPSHMFFKF